jgi:hypothetical protein
VTASDGEQEWVRRPNAAESWHRPSLGWRVSSPNESIDQFGSVGGRT